MSFVVACSLAPRAAHAQRAVQSLNGTWQIEESVSADAMPSDYGHTVPVPGLVRLAEPAFENAGAFFSYEFLRNRYAPQAAPRVLELDTAGVYRKRGIALQERGYYWYRTTFDAPEKRGVARLKINKAKYGTAVWLNGEKLGGVHFDPFAPSFWNLTGAIRWAGENTLVVRTGAHPGVVPRSVLTGTDLEKVRWHAGIYDAVSISYMYNPVIERVQVAPRIDSSLIVVQTHLKNYGVELARFTLRHRVATREAEAPAAEPTAREMTLAPGEEETVVRRIPIPDARLWSPKDPFLYVVETTTGGDSKTSRFGMRNFRFDTVTKRAYLNGKPIYLRGSNITLHRFFEDPKMGTKPWDEDWVRRLLGELPDEMHWNAFRFCIGPVPEMWLEIADEVGLLIQNEYMVWTYRDAWDTEQVIGQYKNWVRANWNHPSVVLWDASNETRAPIYAEEIIPAVRKIDLSRRPWDNGYDLPAGPNDPIEDHPYWVSHQMDTDAYPGFEKLTGGRSTNAPHPTAHPAVINEYNWLWLHRDGTPTPLTQDVWGYLTAPSATSQERLRLRNYLLAGETEFWRAHRNFAGVLHFVYLTSDYPRALTADHFESLAPLDLHDSFLPILRAGLRPFDS